MPSTPLGAHYLFYLNTPRKICLQRISSRGRAGEANISSLYLKGLEKEYRKYLMRFEELRGGESVSEVDSSDSAEVLKTFMNFLKVIIDKEKIE